MPQLPDKLLEEYTEIYTLIDPKNDGYIDAPKLFKALHTVGFEPTEAEVMDIIDAVDVNKSEKIEFVELVDMMLSRDQPTLTDKELRDAFCLFDADEDGIISADDAKPIFSRQEIVTFSYKEINDIIAVADYNKDGLVTMEDFITAVKRV
ncbi:hypothetical protein HELRODRAFT_65938 [Helobdella robusta]|uniref:EF-hand domain-containing protein n=1 Tax=Helobdella robusta TaxID=6412 RepID=T1FYE6_HELRO|nr:hypothetical protein HELRODRAFT_65938 [Helobdella robusta]ESO01879.1 hypothetical protein HELRODRAFT_65938 [Helobdella robusta]